MRDGNAKVAASRRAVMTGGLAFSLAACSGNLIGPPSPAPELYLLNPQFGPVPDGPIIRQQLVVALPVAPAALDTDRIALERAPNTLDYFAHCQWADRLPLLLQLLLVEAFEKSGRVPAVGREGAGLRADVVLDTEIRDFEAYYAVPDAAPEIRAKFMVKLLGATRHDVLGTTEIARSVQSGANDLPRITAAFEAAAGGALSEIVRWNLAALSYASPKT